jgi:hypothetical protein
MDSPEAPPVSEDLADQADCAAGAPESIAPLGHWVMARELVEVDRWIARRSAEEEAVAVIKLQADQRRLKVPVVRELVVAEVNQDLNTAAGLWFLCWVDQAEAGDADSARRPVAAVAEEGARF